MEKRIVKEIIFSDEQDGCLCDVRLKDLPLYMMNNDDIIDIQRVEREDEYDREYTLLQIFRERLENDKELKERILEMENFRKESDERRYKLYLELKQEFENNVWTPIYDIPK